MSRRSRWIAITLSFLFLGWLLALLLSGWQLQRAIQQRDWQATRIPTQRLDRLLTPVHWLLSPFSPDWALLAYSLRHWPAVAATVVNLETYLPLAWAGDRQATPLAQQLQTQLPQLADVLTEWLRRYQAATFLPEWAAARVAALGLNQALANPDQLRRLIESGVPALSPLLSGQHRVVVLFQNTDELRATGGFAGSYLLVELSDGVLTQMNVQDIYVPDGQFRGYHPAPPGVAEYLSSGNGLRLPDANWSPDFPSSAQELIKFFALGKENQVETVVALNLTAVEELLRLTGPIYLPDYQQTVTAENLFQVARADRAQFFAGSQKKRHFLQAALNQVELRLAERLASQPQLLLELLPRLGQQKQLQAYSHHPQLQNWFTQLGLTGQVDPQGSQRYFFLVESNVGINKVNRFVQRQVELELGPSRSRLSINFANDSRPTTRATATASTTVTPTNTSRPTTGHQDYINYFRILIPPNYQVAELTVAGNRLQRWDEAEITTAGGITVKQVGYLIPVGQGKVVNTTISLTHPELPYQELVLQKQAGTPATPYRVTTPTKTLDLLLEQDLVLGLE